MKTAESSPKTLSEKEKLLVRSNLSFSQCFQKFSTADTFWKGFKRPRSVAETTTQKQERILQGLANDQYCATSTDEDRTRAFIT